LMSAVVVGVVGYVVLAAAILTGSAFLAKIVVALAAIGLLILAHDGDLVTAPTDRRSLWQLWLTFRRDVERSLVKRTTAHVLIWLVFGVVLAVVPFVWAYFSSLSEAIAWGEIIHPPELVLLAIALAAGACSELFLRTLLVEEVKFTPGAKWAYGATVVAIVVGLSLYGNISKPGSEVSRADNYLCWGALAVALLLAIFTITVNERSEHFIRLDEERRREELERLREELPPLREELERLRKASGGHPRSHKPNCPKHRCRIVCRVVGDDGWSRWR
jgi:hypothetical protein